MDLIGEFHPPASHGHCYALTAVCMLTGFTWCMPLKTKTAEEVTKACIPGPHLQLIWRKCQNTDRQWDRAQEQVLQGSHHQTELRIFHPFTTIQTTKQWEDRGIPQVPESMHLKVHQPWIGMG